MNRLIVEKIVRLKTFLSFFRRVPLLAKSPVGDGAQCDARIEK